MLNIDTLTKSKADAEEERQANKNSAEDELYTETQSSRFSRQRNAPVDSVSPMEDKSITVEHYLMYNNPLAITSPQYRFVSDLLRTGKLLNLLPSATACHACFSSESQLTVNTESAWTPGRTEQVTESQTKAWKEVIGDEVKRKRRSSRKSNREEVLRQWRTEGNARFRSSQLQSNTVDWKFQTISEQFHLNYEQKAAFDIFTNPLKTLLLDKNERVNDSPEPYLNNRCMFLSGSGGTGKSQVIHAIQTIFEQAGCNDMLVVSATTGCAANLIEGSTIDSICKFTRKRKITAIGVSYSDDESDTVTTIDNSWSIIKFLIVDEASMLGCYKLNRISKALQKLKHSTLPFGGLYILFSGDFHQLPPVQDKCLYHTTRLSESMQPGSERRKARALANQQGYNLWRKVTETTVVLTQNYRATDKSLMETLERLRVGALTVMDIERIQQRVFGHPRGPNISDPKWQSAMLVTTRNAVRQAWNNQAALRHSLKNNSQMFISPASDKGIQCRRSDMIWTPDSKTEFLATWNVLCIGGPAVVTANIAVELGIANGTEAIIRDVIPHPLDDQAIQQRHNRIVELTRPPICVLIEPLGRKKWDYVYYRHYPTWFPIMPITEQMKAPKEFKTEKVFERTQIPLTSAFALSDHKVLISIKAQVEDLN
jgi:hypothetical protein